MPQSGFPVHICSPSTRSQDPPLQGSMLHGAAGSPKASCIGRVEENIQGTAVLHPARAPRGHHLPVNARGKIFNPLAASAGFLGPGYEANVRYAPERDQNRRSEACKPPCREQRLLRGHGSAAGQRHLQPLGPPEETPRPGMGHGSLSPSFCFALHNPAGKVW